jgi:tetratricopeptide (TPR) repeat protein
VFASHWLQALPLTVQTDGAILTKHFDPHSDATIWSIVDAQNVKAPDTWRIPARNAQGGWINSTGVQPNATQAQLTGMEAQLDALVNNEKRSAVKFSNEMLQVDSHLLAHQILGSLLTGRDPGHFKASGPRDVIRICQTRRSLVYSLAKVPAERVAAAFLFLAELAVAEHQSELAETLVTRALEITPTAAHAEPATLAFLIKGLSQQVRADFAAAAESYQGVLKTPKVLARTGRDLMYRALVTTMAVGGNLPGATLALERWCAEDNYNKDIAAQLGKAYLLADRKADAVRALSTAAEFAPEIGANYDTPESFLKMIESK